MRIFLLGCVVLFAFILILAALKSRKVNTSATRRRRRDAPLFESSTPEKVVDADSALGLYEHDDTVMEEKPAAVAKIDYVIMHVMAPKEERFGGYRLLQTLLGCGLRLGRDKIFHRYCNNSWQEKYFSLTSVNRPGTFDLPNMNQFSCPGLTLFMVIEDCLQPLQSFDMMYRTAKQLAEELGGEVWDENREPIREPMVKMIRHDLEKQMMVTVV
ncbi:MAG: hypothetical protein A3F10_02470 [Coxiella sp. RIFCSPHIGHO2_12_FULL_42_15]|nr:MAG: hypothetical protein A3F10_02470 [Coxiella sp. RIFCSPHIGHO2_12_FULL_42_15]